MHWNYDVHYHFWNVVFYILNDKIWTETVFNMTYSIISSDDVHRAGLCKLWGDFYIGPDGISGDYLIPIPI